MALSFSHAILEWARNKPADQAYDFTSFCNCAVAQFLKETGRSESPEVFRKFWEQDGLRHSFPEAVDNAAVGTCYRESWTFGAFADRLEQALAK